MSLSSLADGKAYVRSWREADWLFRHIIVSLLLLLILLFSGVNGDCVHANNAVVDITAVVRRHTTSAAVVAESNHAGQSDAELLAEPAIDDEVDGRLDCQQ